MKKEYNNWLKENKMQSTYHSCEVTRGMIDKLLSLNASLQATLGTDSTREDRQIVKSKTEKLMNEIKEIDPSFHDIINLN